MNAKKAIRILAIAVLPMPLKRMFANAVLGWSISASAKIGVSIVDVDYLEMADRTRIGHFSVLRDLRKASLAAGAHLGQWNWISASTVLTESSPLPLAGTIAMGTEAAITSRHYIDCSGGFELGSFSTIAGVRSTILTHQIDFTSNVQTTSAVRIGNHCFVGSDVKFVPGTLVGDRSLVAMGSVVSKPLPAQGVLYAGVPARPVREISGAFFQRQIGITAPAPNRETIEPSGDR